MIKCCPLNIDVSYTKGGGGGGQGYFRDAVIRFFVLCES